MLSLAMTLERRLQTALARASCNDSPRLLEELYLLERLPLSHEPLPQCGRVAEGGGILVPAGTHVPTRLAGLVGRRAGRRRLDPAQAASELVFPRHLHVVRRVPGRKVPAEVPAHA